MAAFNLAMFEWLKKLIDEGDAIEIYRIRSFNDEASAATLATWFVRQFNEEQSLRYRPRNYSITHFQNTHHSLGAIMWHGWDDDRNRVIEINADLALQNVVRNNATVFTFIACSGSFLIFLKQRPDFDLLVHNFVSNTTRVVPIPYGTLSAFDITLNPENHLVHVYTRGGEEHVLFVIFKVVSHLNVRVSLYDSYDNPLNHWQLIKSQAVFSPNLDTHSLIFKPVIFGQDVYFVTVQNHQVLFQRMELDIVCQPSFPVKLATVDERVIIKRVVSSANSHGNWIAAIVSKENGSLTKVKQISLFEFNRVSRCYDYVSCTLSNFLHADEWMALAGCFVEASRHIVQVSFLFNAGGLAQTRVFVYDLRSCHWRSLRVSDLPYLRVSTPRLSSTLTI